MSSRLPSEWFDRECELGHRFDAYIDDGCCSHLRRAAMPCAAVNAGAGGSIESASLRELAAPHRVGGLFHSVSGAPRIGDTRFVHSYPERKFYTAVVSGARD